jgi:DNA-binding GntR family transcriptional regulator
MNSSTVGRSSHRTLNDRVHQRLRWSLLTGVLEPGHTMAIRKLADSLGTSTMPIRDALKRLIAERGLEVLPNRRVRVPSLSPDRLGDLFAIRHALEGLATERAAEHLTSHQLARLEALCERMDESVRNNDIDGYLADNYSFHFTIYDASNSPDLFLMIEGLWLRTGPSLRGACLAYGLIDGLNAHHRKALSALRARDAAAARSAIEQDLSYATRNFLGRASAKK